MQPALHMLTEKEKQTLRLLVEGYDAKSMARHLGLSVHTVNERLRDARRKLSTPSSREAARLLREVEQRTPETLGDKALGDAPATSAAQTVLPPDRSDRNRRRAGWIIGGIAMTISLALLALSGLSGTSQAPAVPLSGAAAAAVAAPHSAVEAEAVAAARRWLELVDAQDWKASYELTGNAFRSANTFEGWTKAALSVHGKFGPARSRELVVAEETPAPPAGNVVVKFRASYANKPEGTELLTMVREDGVWKVSGIYVD